MCEARGHSEGPGALVSSAQYNTGGKGAHLTECAVLIGERLPWAELSLRAQAACYDCQFPGHRTLRTLRDCVV